MVVSLGFLVLLCCGAALAGLESMPPMPNYQSMSEAELLAYVSEQPGMEFLKEQTNQSIAAMNLENALHPDLLEDSILLTHELVRKYGYLCEIHTVRTSDGFTLEIHRIPGSPKSLPRIGKIPVYLQHGLFDSSAGWVIMGPHHGFAYMLADLGYDVWLGNARGNRYSRKHDTHDPDGGRGDRRRFWDFSWHEIGTIDLPAVIDYITLTTGQQRMHYAGHSQGTTAFFVMASVLPEYNDRIISMNALAPIAYMSHLRSPIARGAAHFMETLDRATSVLGVYEFLPNNEQMTALGQSACRDESHVQFICTNFLFLFGGFNIAQMNTTMLPVIMGHTPAGASVNQLIHYGQGIQSGLFRQYDHGILNMMNYRSRTPPLYNLGAIRAPVALHYSLNDWLAEPVDVEQLERELGNVAASYVTADPKFNHFDFIWGIDARSMIYDQAIEIMQRFE